MVSTYLVLLVKRLSRGRSVLRSFLVIDIDDERLIDSTLQDVAVKKMNMTHKPERVLWVR